jgi:hypothetical protein
VTGLCRVATMVLELEVSSLSPGSRDLLK